MSCAFQFKKYYDGHSYNQTLLSPSWCNRKKTWDIQGFKIKSWKDCSWDFQLLYMYILSMVFEMLEILKYNCI